MSNRAASATTRRRLALAVAATLLPLGLIGEPAIGQTQAAVVVIRGGGWGHGVGMSQYGAYGRAVAGASATEIVTAYYPGSTVGPIASEITDLRVHLGTAPTVDVTTSGPLLVLADEQAALAPGGAVLHAYRTDSLVPVVNVELPGVCDPGACVGAVVRLPLAEGQPVTLSTTGRHYHRGSLVLRPDGAGISVAVEGLTPDQYLYGLAEMPAGWPAAALQAQALAARSYAAHRAATSRSAGSPYDLVATTADQVYAGYDKEAAPGAAAWMTAVDATSGQYVARQGRPVLAFYSSSNGGWSDSGSYVFGGPDDIAAAYVDPWDAYQNPNAVWQRSIPGAEATAWLRPATGDIGDLVTLSVIGPTGLSGRIDQALVHIVGTTGEAQIAGRQLRDLLNAGLSDAGRGDQLLLSTRFTVAVIAIPELSLSLAQPLEPAPASTDPAASPDPASTDPASADPASTGPTEPAPPDLIGAVLADHPPVRADAPGVPRGAAAIVGGELGQLALGWAVDTDRPIGDRGVAEGEVADGDPPVVQVRVTIDGLPVAVVLANQPTNHGPAATDSSLTIGFAAPVMVPPGLHAICAEGLDEARTPTLIEPEPPDQWVVLGCQLFESPAQSTR